MRTDIAHRHGRQQIGGAILVPCEGRESRKDGKLARTNKDVLYSVGGTDASYLLTLDAPSISWQLWVPSKIAQYASAL